MCSTALARRHQCSHLWKMASVVIILHISTSADICRRLNYVLREVRTCSVWIASCDNSHSCLMQDAFNNLFVFGPQAPFIFCKVFCQNPFLFLQCLKHPLSSCSFLSDSTMYRGVCPWSVCVS